MNKTPIHQWTHKSDRVLIVKCAPPSGITHNDFQWPLTVGSKVKPARFSRKPDCESGGLFGWPWGMGIGDGKEPNATHTWLVFSAKPQNVIGGAGELESKCKAVPDETDGDECAIIEYVGTQAGAMYFTMEGRIAWIQDNSSGSASATGYRGSASATGNSGSASATGTSGSASATGTRGSASATGDSGSASATGKQGCAVSLGIDSIASGEKGCWLTISEWSNPNGTWQRIDVKTVKVDGKKIKANVKYKLIGGKFQEVL